MKNYLPTFPFSQLSTRMHDTATAGGYQLDSSGAGGPQLELTTPGPCGRRTARRPGTAGTRSIPPAPGPIYGARRRQDAPRTIGRTAAQTDGDIAPLARLCGPRGLRGP